ncbi:hypothetical protein EHO51_09590 [Methylocystis rosea]|uniref:Uncharacterized protein n=1 Tax=Methylocystis rosea TaxID=173366 RepID=A0A3G8M5V6_9HYPH|nr:hypothetical protein EHO51_09590 [Methylocystis rosea]
MPVLDCGTTIGKSGALPIAWIHVIDKESLKIKMLEQVLIEKVRQLFRNLLSHKSAVITCKPS